MELSDSQKVSKAYSVWYYKWIDDPNFNPDNPSEEFEKDYEQILKDIMNGTFKE